MFQEEGIQYNETKAKIAEEELTKELEKIGDS